MKRSRSIRLVLIGGLSAGTIVGCSPSGSGPRPIDANAVYTNNYFVPGVGYYHAPFRQWYPTPYNQFDPRTQRYFYGGLWNEHPHQSITNISEPLPNAAMLAEAQRTDVVRGGFGRTSSSYHGWGIHS